MKHMFTAMIAAMLISTLTVTPSRAAPCDADPALREAVRSVLTEAGDARINGWARYLNDAFYRDVACRLSPGMSAQDVRVLRGAPEVLIDLAMGAVMTRNQSDALMLMLSAMKQGAGDQG